MSVTVGPSVQLLLAHHEGDALYSAPEAMLKGLLEAETPTGRVFGPESDRFLSLFRLAAAEPVAELLRLHETSVHATPSAARAIALADAASRAGENAMAIVPNVELDESASALARAARDRGRGAAGLVVVLEDDPHGSRHRCPRERIARLGLPWIEPADLSELRDAMEIAIRLARAARTPTAVVVHHSLLCASETMLSYPNRASEDVDAMLARRRRRRWPGGVEGTGVLRLVRRLELNRTTGLPSPGERVDVGFIATGRAIPAIRHLVQALHRSGRVPILCLGAPSPLDEAAVARLLGRCAQVIVLEARPGTVEASIRAVATDMQERGERTATVWGRRIPGDERGAYLTIDDEVSLHPSHLARCLMHLLESIRPSGEIHAQLDPATPPVDVAPPPRGRAIGLPGALAVVRQIVADTDQWVREREPDAEEDAEFVPTGLAVDGTTAEAIDAGTVLVETWGPTRFRREGVAALRDAARDKRPSILLICDVDNNDQMDLERLARGVIPADRVGRVEIVHANLVDTAALGDLLRAACLRRRVTIVIVGDGPPARWDLAATDRALAEIDRLGYEPRQAATWPADRICAVRPHWHDDQAEARATRENSALRTTVRVDHVASRPGARVRYRVRPLIQNAEVIRTRPPQRRWRDDRAGRLPRPEFVHRTAPQWRAHLAGFRSGGAGLAATVLCQAGRLMGYDVRAEHDPTAIGAGRRAWAEILFTRPRADEAPEPLVARTPFGDADLLLGLDAAETLRAIATDPDLRVAGGDRTFAVVNDGFFRDEPRTDQATTMREQLRTLLRDTTRSHGRIVEDFADACRVRFHTDRVTDLVLLGAAFQSGLIPVRADAIEAALQEAEASGYGRSTEAFRLGRTLALDHRAFRRLREEREDEGERMIRRMLRRVGPRRKASAEAFCRLLRTSLEGMPGLTESDAGRQARRDFAAGLYRAVKWGGIDYAERYARRITALYRADRGESGRALARNAILPLAGAMLVRDLIYVSTMSVSDEQRREIRQQLNVKPARNDELRRRFLTRLEIALFGYRLRIDVGTSDWPAVLLAAVRRFIPVRSRGSRRERALRRDLERLVDDAIRFADERYEYFRGAFTRLHRQAAEQTLRGMAAAELKMLVDPAAVTGVKEAKEETKEETVTDAAEKMSASQ